MISPAAFLLRTALRGYTYPYRRRFASLSRSVRQKNTPYRPPAGFSFSVESFGGVRVEKLVPPDAAPGNIVQFHGGGHTVAMNAMYRRAAERLAKACSRTVYSIDYPTGENLMYPAVHDACFRCWRALLETVLSRDDFFAIGDSFGANLLLSTCLRARDMHLALPSRIVCVCSFLDMAASGSSYRVNGFRDPLYGMPKGYDFEKYERKIRRISPYCANMLLTNPDLSPVYADFHDFPPVLILCGGWETSCSDSQMLYEKLRQADCPAQQHVFDGMWHDFMYLFPTLKESRTAWREVTDFLTE